MSSARSLAFVLTSLMVLLVAHPQMQYQSALEGAIAEAQTDAYVRDTIPVGLLHNSQVVGVVSEGEHVVVLEVKDVKTVVRTDQWLRVRAPRTGVTGWAFNGTWGDASTFLPVRAQG